MQVDRLTVSQKIVGSIILLFLAVSICLGIVSFFSLENMANSVHEQTLLEKLIGDINSTHVYLEKIHGKISLKDETLVDNSNNKIDGNFTFVDLILKDLNDLSTIFIKNGDDFYRVSTNVKNDKGERAVGTPLGKASAAYASLMKGEKYIGNAMILGKPYLTAYDPIKDGNGMIIGVLFIGLDKTEVEKQINQTIYNSLLKYILFSILFLIISFLIALFMARKIVKPIQNTIQDLTLISQGDLTKRLKSLGEDELGALAISINDFVLNLNSMISNFKNNANRIQFTASEMSTLGSDLTVGTEMVISMASTISVNAEQSSLNTTTLASKMNETSKNINSVASATEQMSVTISEISANAEKARSISMEAENQAEKISTNMNRLGTAAQKIGKITEVITKISTQTNLLALNATIEAARAGDAGKSFAVVANAIKELANQTSEATDDIKLNISSVQNNVSESIADIDTITQIISKVRLIVTGIASAIEQQSIVTKDLAGNISQASVGVSDANESIVQTANSTKEIATSTTGIQMATGEMGSSAEQLQKNSAELIKLSEMITNLVNKYKISDPNSL